MREKKKKNHTTHPRTPTDMVCEFLADLATLLLNVIGQ